MKNNFTAILKDIQQTIASFSEGDISFDEALHKYHTYKEKALEIKSQPQYENYILNVLATHNAENFSLFSAIVAYTAKNEQTTISLYHGPDVFVQPLLSLCNNSFFSSPPRYVLDYTINQNVIQNFSLYSSSLFHSEELSLAFIAISSSSFFSKETFLHYAAHIKVFTGLLGISDIISLDVPNTTLKYIHQVCSKLLTKGPCSLYGIYIISPFSTLSHFGLHSLNEVSALIKNTLIENFGQYSFALSMNLYLCIHTNTQADIKPLTFNYKDISIPSKIYHTVIEKEEDIIPAIIHILHFH
ncbi:MAG: hypothetical protein AB1444_04590 [Spirochaetota bacterium]